MARFVMTTPAEALAVIDGSLCELGQFGVRTLRHAPLATAVVEFRRGALRTYVREHPFGLLPGLPNLYCLDGDDRLLWMAEWPYPEDPCAVIVDELDGSLVVMSVSGAVVRIDSITGRLLGWSPRVEATG